MKIFLLISCMSMVTLLCSAQGPVTDAGVGVPLTDSSLFISNLVSSTRENSKIVLNWKNNIGASVDFVAVERSGNGQDFEVVAILKQASPTQEYEWTDDAPIRGRNLYRIRFTSKEGQTQYSKVIAAHIAGDISFRFYPNPVDNILIIRSESLRDIQIVDASGKVRISQPKLQGLQTINVATLEKGLYIMRIYNHVTGNTTQEKLLKN